MKRMKLEADFLPFQGKKGQLAKMEESHKSGHWPN